MDVPYDRCCGLDIHEKTVMACLIVPGPGGQPVKEVRSYRRDCRPNQGTASSTTARTAASSGCGTRPRSKSRR
jgi:hypothetical protein